MIHQIKKHAVAVIILLSVLVILAAGAYYYQYQKTQQLLKNPTIAGQMEVTDLVKKVSMLMELPTNEVPTIATVSDAKKLQGQPFFQNAKNGFKVLIYVKAKKAILYDPFMNKVADVGPINIAQPTAVTATVKVTLYNGTTNKAITGVVMDDLITRYPNINIIQTTKAKAIYPLTQVIDLTGGSQQALVQQLATHLGGSVSAIPQNEVIPQNSQILIILGKK